MGASGTRLVWCPRFSGCSGQWIGPPPWPGPPRPRLDAPVQPSTKQRHPQQQPPAPPHSTHSSAAAFKHPIQPTDLIRTPYSMERSPARPKRSASQLDLTTSNHSPRRTLSSPGSAKRQKNNKGTHSVLSLAKQGWSSVAGLFSPTPVKTSGRQSLTHC